MIAPLISMYSKILFNGGKENGKQGYRSNRFNSRYVD